MTTDRNDGAELERPRRLSLSEIVERLLDRGSSEHSSVTIGRNSKGDTTLEVIVRTGTTEGIESIEDAETAATAVYERLRTAYPFGRDGANGGDAS